MTSAHHRWLPAAALTAQQIERFKGAVYPAYNEGEKPVLDQSSIVIMKGKRGLV